MPIVKEKAKGAQNEKKGRGLKTKTAVFRTKNIETKVIILLKNKQTNKNPYVGAISSLLIMLILTALSTEAFVPDTVC